MKNRSLKKLTLFGFIALAALAFASVASAAISVTPDHFNVFAGYSFTTGGYVQSTTDLSGYTLSLSGGESAASQTEWNGVTITLTGDRYVYIAGTGTEPGLGVFTVTATLEETETVSGDVMAASFTVSILDEEISWRTGSALDLTQTTISDRDGEHMSTYFVPNREAAITIPIVAGIDEFFGVYVTEPNGNKRAMPYNNPITGGSVAESRGADGYYWNATSGKLEINYTPLEIGEFFFNIYYYQDGSGALRRQQKIIEGENPGSDGDGCSAGTGLFALALAAGFAIARRKR